MPGIKLRSPIDIALATGAANSIPYSLGPGAGAGTDANFAWDAAAKSHVVKATDHATAAITQVAVAAFSVTITTAAPHGFVVGDSVIISGLSATEINGASVIGSVPDTTTFVFDSGFAVNNFATTPMAGTAAAVRQAGNLATFLDGGGGGLFTIGPLARMTIEAPAYQRGSVLDIVKNSGFGQHMVRFRNPSFAGPDIFVTCIDTHGSYRSVVELVISGHYTGSGDTQTILPPTIDSACIGIWSDTDSCFQMRDNTGGGSFFMSGVRDDTGEYTFRMLKDGEIGWCQTTSQVPGTQQPLADVTLGRLSSGLLGLGGSLRIAGTSHAYENKLLRIIDDTTREIFVVTADGRGFFGQDTAQNAKFIVTKPADAPLGRRLCAFQDLSSTGTPLLFLDAGDHQMRFVLFGATGTIAFGNSGLNETQLILDTATGGLSVSGSLSVGGGTPVLKILSATATLDFGSTAAQTSADLTISVTGAAVGDTVSLGLPAAPAANTSFSAWVSAADLVTIRHNNYSAGAVDPASGIYRASVTKF